MPDVGVLNLTIKDNSQEAAAGLDKLVSAMQRVKNAVSGAMNLNNYSVGLQKLCKIVDDNLHGSTIIKLSQLADSLQKLKNAGGSLSALGKLTKMTDGFSTASEQVETLKTTVNEVKQSVGKGIDIPVRTVVDPHLSTLYRNDQGYLLGNTKETLDMQRKYAPLPERTFDDYYNGDRWRRDKETGENIKYHTNDLMSNWLHGQGTESEQLYAIQQVAQACGMSVDEVRQRLAELKGETDSVTSSVQGAVSQTSHLSDTADKASWSLQDLKNKIGGLKKSASQNIFGRLLNSFARIVKYRMIRAVIKNITSGFREGLENVYNYSKAINGSLAPAMDSAVSMFAQMKNSLGAAVAPLLQSLIPLLNTVVSGFINVVNWANQLIALLNGQASWTRALPQTVSAFDKQKKAAKGAGAAIKDLLADWDELNIIQSESTSSGATTAAEDYLKMFEEVNVFDNKIKKITDFIKDNYNDILDIAKKIGLAVLAWKASTAFTGLLSDLFALSAAGLIIGITWDITSMVDHQYMKTGDTGWLVADALTNLLGATLAGGIVSTVLGGAAGIVTAGLTLVVSAGISYGISLTDEEGDKAKALQDLAAIKAAIGTAALAVGFGIASGSALIGIGVAAVVAAPLFTLTAAVAVVVEQYRNAEEIAREAFSKTGEGGIKVDEVFKALQDELDKATAGYSLVIDAFSGSSELKTNLAEAFESVKLLSATVKGDGKLTQKEAEEFKKAWTTVFESFEGLAETSFDTVFAGLNKSLSSENEEIREQAKQLRISVLMMQENLSEAMAEFKLEQQDLADKIGKGTATSEEVETYFRNLELVAKASRSSLTDLETILSGRKNIDFGDPYHAAEEAAKFIKDTQEASVKALEEIEQGYKAEIDAIDVLWRQTELAHDLGKISDDQYDTYKEIFDSMRENFTKEAEAEKSKVTSDVQSAYKAVIDQALYGIANIPGVMDDKGNLDVLKVSAYMTEIMLPVLEAAQDAGAEFSEDFGKMFGIGVNIKDWIGEGWVTKLSDYIKDLMENPPDQPETPGLDNTALNQSVTDAKASVDDMCSSIRASIASLEGLGFSFDTNTNGGGNVTGRMRVTVPKIATAATGGFIKSGDLIMANENGNIEMMGTMGNNRSVVANNQQIVEGISQANNGVISAIEELGNYIVRELQKSRNQPIQVNLNPSSSWGNFNARSAEQYSHVTG